MQLSWKGAKQFSWDTKQVRTMHSHSDARTYSIFVTVASHFSIKFFIIFSFFSYRLFTTIYLRIDANTPSLSSLSCHVMSCHVIFVFTGAETQFDNRGNLIKNGTELIGHIASVLFLTISSHTVVLC